MKMIRASLNIFTLMVIAFSATIWLPPLIAWQVMRWHLYGDQDLISTDVLLGNVWLFKD